MAKPSPPLSDLLMTQWKLPGRIRFGPHQRRTLLLVLLLLGSFQAGRVAERSLWPCRLRPIAALVAPLLGQELPSAELCELLLRIPLL